MSYFNQDAHDVVQTTTRLLEVWSYIFQRVLIAYSAIVSSMIAAFVLGEQRELTGEGAQAVGSLLEAGVAAVFLWGLLMGSSAVGRLYLKQSNDDEPARDNQTPPVAEVREK